MNATDPAIKSLRIQNLLSFGPDSAEIELKPLNVLIGPNGSGKSNLIEIIGLLQNTPKDLAEPIRIGGGIKEWLWKGASKERVVGTIEVVARPPTPPPVTRSAIRRALRRAVRPPAPTIPPPRASFLRYHLSFREAGYQFEIADERIEAAPPTGGRRGHLYFGYEDGRPLLNVKGAKRLLKREQLNPQQSVLSQRKDPDQYPELTHLGRLFSDFKLYRDWTFGIDSAAREGCAADAPNDFLEEDASNLAMMLSRLLADSRVEPGLLAHLKKFYEDAQDIRPNVVEGRVDVRLREKGFTIPAVRLSDGTLRWVSLLTILLHPSPPPLVCIEEPELGLHPDIISLLAKLLLEASERMQLIVTTHSDLLVDALSECPDSVVVCEKHNGSTTLKRLPAEDLAEWLKSYQLGELWRKGEIGGNRW